MTNGNGLTYKQAGVDIEAGAELVERIKPAAASTQRPGVVDGLGGFGAGARAGTRARRKGRTIEHGVEIGLLEALQGKTMALRLDRGQGPETLEVKIPPGVKDGQRIRLAGMGQPGPGGPGDLLLRVRVKPHPLLERRGDDLIMELPVTVEEAVCGATIELPLWSGGSVDLKVPPHSQTGRTLRLRGLGAPKRGANADDKGDLLVRLRVHVPTRSDPKLEELARALSAFYDEDVRQGLRL